MAIFLDLSLKNSLEDKMSNVLVIAAHPDDEVLGCGATMVKLAQQGHKVFTYILGEGVTGRDDQRVEGLRKKEILQLKKQVITANQILNVKKTFTDSFYDNRFDTHDLLDIVKKIEKVKAEVKPAMVFTHFRNDLNIDHRITFQAVLTAFRPLKGGNCKEIYSFEALSATEFNYPLTFSPNFFVDVSETIDLKIKAMKAYKDEIRAFPHPRSARAIELNAQLWGVKVGVNYAEAFELIRKIDE